MKATTIKNWFNIHKWTSLISTIFLLMLCITGLPLIFTEEIDHLLEDDIEIAAPANGKEASVDMVIRAGMDHLPGNEMKYAFWDEKHHPGQAVYLVGTPDLEENFRANGINLTEEQPEVVVIGFDLTLTYEKLMRACLYIRNGAEFLATHLDINCPTQNGFIPDCGSMCAAIALSTGKQPKYTGKPFKETVDYVLEKTGAELEKVTFVGDRLYTDVKTGVNNGAHGILVLSGEAKIEDVAASDVAPDAIFDGLKDMAEMLETL